jgi:DNA polymerase-3 subunit beta
MKLVIDRNELLRSLGHVTSVVEKRTTIPILSNVLLRASEGGLQFRATDLEREVMEAARADISQPGAATVPAHTLHDIVRKLPDGAQVEIRRDNENERLLLASGQSRFTLQTLAAEDFPDLSPGEFSHSFELGASDLKRLIDKTKFAISTEETRYYLTGIYLHPATRDGQPTLRAVATDGHRLAQAETALPAGADGMPGVILPRKTVHELLRLLESSETTVGVDISQAKARFTIGTDKEVGRVTLTTKLIDGTFPDYARVIPKSNDKVLKVPNGAFVAAVDRVSTITSDRGRAVKLNLDDDSLVLSVNNPEGGSATEQLAADYRAGALEIGFNARYLLDIASQIDSDAAQFLLADAGSPMVVKDDSDEGALYVLMPMRV